MKTIYDCVKEGFDAEMAFDPPPPEQRPDVRPGTQAKIDLMRSRLEQGLDMHAEGDFRYNCRISREKHEQDEIDAAMALFRGTTEDLPE